MTKDRRIRLLLAALVLLPLLAAMLSACSTTPTPEEPIVITFAYPQYISLFTKTNFQKLTDAFNEANPDVRIQLREITNSDATGVEDIGRDIMLDEEWEIDVFISQGGAYAGWLAESGRILNLQPLIEADFSWELDDFYPLVLEQFEQGNDLWGIPGEAIPLGIFYNKDLFDQAGVAYPQPGWDLDDFLEKAVALTREEEGESKQYGYTPLDPVCYDLLFFLGQHGATVADVSTRPPRPQLDTPAMVEGVRWYADLALVHGVMPPLYIKDYFRDRDAHLQRQRDLVSTGRVAMWAEYPGNMPAQAFPFRVGMVPLPLGQGKMNQNKIVAYVISVNSPYPEACWQWIKFLTAQPAVVQGVPPRRSLMETPEYQQRVGEEALATFQFALERSVGSVNPVYEEYPWVYTVRRYWFYEAFDRVMEGAEVEEALAEAQAKAEAFVACLGGRVTASEYDDELRKTCAQEVDPDYESW